MRKVSFPPTRSPAFSPSYGVGGRGGEAEFYTDFYTNFYQGGVAPPPVTQDLTIAPPATNDLTVYYAWGLDRLVEGYTGNTVRLKRLSDDVEQDFGFNSFGAFDVSAVDTWRSGADVEIITMYDQIETGDNGSYTTTQPLVVSNVWQRFGTDWSDVDGQLTRKLNSGGIGVNLGGVSAFATGQLTLPVSTGVEMHVLMSPNERNGDATYVRTDTQAGVKTSGSPIITGLTSTAGNQWEVGRYVTAGNGVQETSQILTIDSATQVTLTRPLTVTETSDITVSRDQHGATSDTEYLFWYGTAEANFFRHYTGGDFKDYIRLYNGASDNGSASDQTYHKKFGQYVYSYEINSTEWVTHNNGAVYLQNTLNATNIASVSGGLFDDGGVIVGGRMDNEDFLDAQTFSNQLFGGLIITGQLTDAERFLLRSKLSAVGQQHRIDSLENTIGLFDEVVLMKNINPVTGRVIGENGLLTLDFNLIDQGDGVPTWDFTYDTPEIGLTGVKCDGQVIGNAFKATDNYFAGTLNGTVAAIHMETTDNTTISHAFVQGDGSEFQVNRINMSLSMGYDHTPVTSMVMVADDRDDDTVVGVRKFFDGVATGYDLNNQIEVKYNEKVGHGGFTYGETWGGHTYDIDDYRNEGDQPKDFDAPVVRHTADNLTFPLKGDVLTVQITTFQAPAGYDRADDYATRKPLILQSDNWSYASDGISPIGQRDGSMANNPYGSVCDSTNDARIMTRPRSQVFEGVRYGMYFAERVFTVEEVERFQVNSWKTIT